MAKTLERDRYEATKRNQATMRQVTTLLERESDQVLSLAEQLDKQSLGGYLRTVVPGLVDRYGNVNMVAAMQYYDEQRLAAMKSLALSNRASDRLAAKKLQGQLYVAKMAPIDSVELSEPIIGYGMKRYVDDGFDAMKTAVQNSMTRAVASYNRNTILYNSALDEAVVKVQRVAEPSACAFCALMAFSSTRSASGESLDVRTTQYAVDFHDHCNCSIETLYIGDSPIRPDYYDKFESEYIDATSAIDGPLTAKGVLSEIRTKTGRS